MKEVEWCSHIAMVYFEFEGLLWLTAVLAHLGPGAVARFAIRQHGEVWQPAH